MNNDSLDSLLKEIEIVLENFERSFATCAIVEGSVSDKAMSLKSKAQYMALLRARCKEQRDSMPPNVSVEGSNAILTRQELSSFLTTLDRFPNSPVTLMVHNPHNLPLTGSITAIASTLSQKDDRLEIGASLRFPSAIAKNQ